MIDDKFIEKIPTEFNKGVKYFLNYYRESVYPSGKFTGPTVRTLAKLRQYDEYIDFYYGLEAYLNANKYVTKPISLTDNKSQNISQIETFIATIKSDFEKRATIDFHEESRQKYNMIFDNVFRYEFTDGDLERIQTLLNELRNTIVKSKIYTAEHQQRILKKLEKLQGELHKKVSDLDRFWGLIGEAGIALGKFGKDAKPFVDRIKEIADIVWRTQSRAEELPSGTTFPLLTDKRDDK
jgi:hypothetical protein